MQKISSYLYSNRVQLLADLAGFTVEYTNVYQRIVKIYKGVDNVIEFDIKNADQKRIELVTDPVFTDIMLNVMDAAGNNIGQYEVTPSTTLKGIAVATIPSTDLEDLTPQFFNYSVTVTKDTNTVLLYADSRFGAIGKLELVGSAVVTPKVPRVYKDHVSEINLNGEVISHSSAIPTKFYEAIPTTQMNIDVDIEDFVGVVYIQGTKDSTISVESWKNEPRLMEFSYNVGTTSTVHFRPLDIGDFNYFRVSWENSSIQRVSLTNPEGLAGRVVQITANVGSGI